MIQFLFSAFSVSQWTWRIGCFFQILKKTNASYVISFSCSTLPVVAIHDFMLFGQIPIGSSSDRRSNYFWTGRFTAKIGTASAASELAGSRHLASTRLFIDD